MRAFADADLVQSTTGTATAASSATVTLPSGTAEGNAGLVFMYAGGVTTSPENWDVIASESTTLLRAYLRSDLPAGESSWSYASAGTGTWLWGVAEWANMASAPVQSTTTATSGLAPSSLSTGSTGTFSAEFVMGIAVFSVTNGSTAGSAAWPSVSYDSGFTETDSVQVGTGTGSNDILLKIARLYGTDSDTGPWSCTATFTGNMTNKSARAVLAVLAAEETAVPPIVITG